MDDNNKSTVFFFLKNLPFLFLIDLRPDFVVWLYSFGIGFLECQNKNWCLVWGKNNINFIYLK